MTAPVTSIAMLAVAAVSAAGAVGMLLAFVYGLGRSDANAAREEAIALAATRAELIRDLKARLKRSSTHARSSESRPLSWSSS